MKRAIAVSVMAVFSLAAACAPSVPTPTPTPEPRPTPVEVLATKPEHLEGIWFNPALPHPKGQGFYYRFEADGTIYYGYTLEDLREIPLLEARFWFEEGVYYEEGACESIGSYRVYLHIEEGRAVRLRFEEIGDWSCYSRPLEMKVPYVRVDR